jgi:hypothetical protein
VRPRPAVLVLGDGVSDVSNTQQPTPNNQHPTPNIQHPTPDTPTPSTKNLVTAFPQGPGPRCSLYGPLRNARAGCGIAPEKQAHPPVIRLLERRERLGIPADLLGPVLGHVFGGDRFEDSAARALSSLSLRWYRVSGRMICSFVRLCLCLAMTSVRGSNSRKL